MIDVRLQGAALRQHLSFAAKQAMHVLLPPRCASCRVMVAEKGTLCGDCWQDLSFITSPMCACCGLPFAYDMGEGALCASCTADHPAYDTARAALRYDEHSRKLVTQLKYADQTHVVPLLARMMARVLPPALLASKVRAANLVVVPVPLHRYRLFTRRYNQSALLASAIAKDLALPYCPDMLLRVKHTPPQASLSKAARGKNVQGAFSVHPKQKVPLKGKEIVLIDDVLTTGATLQACAKKLRQGGAKAVHCLTLARTVLPGEGG